MGKMPQICPVYPLHQMTVPLKYHSVQHFTYESLPILGLKWFTHKDICVERLSEKGFKEQMAMLKREVRGMTEDRETEKFISQYSALWYRCVKGTWEFCTK